MLPSYLLASGTLAHMRTTARDFMQSPINIYNVTLGYSQYGEQTTSSGLVYSTSGYIGAITGSDRELLSAFIRTGVDTNHYATILLPFDTDVRDTYIMRFNNADWRVVWHTNDTMDAVQIYTKCIVGRLTQSDEKEFA